MAWFIGQSAVMILLAFLLGVLVGWIIWGRRLRALLIEVRALRAAKADCEANHGAAAAVPAVAAAAPMHIPAPRAEVADTADLDMTVHHPASLDDPDDDDDIDFESLDAEPVDEPVAVSSGAGSVGVEASGVAANDVDADDAVDDFVRIEGIGPKIAAALVAADIRTYHKLANSRPAALTSAINNAGITFAPSLVTWAQQARLLADGDEAGFLALTDRLIAGRDASTPQNGAGLVAEPEPAPEPRFLPDPDDLARIEGIGPKIAAALVAAGIRTFGQLADADAAALQTAISAAGITFAPSLATWSEQARLLADGHEDEFAILTARLIAGRRADDDLQRIEGIGPKMAAALHAAGIRTYRALAESSDTKLRNAISGSGLSFAPSIVTWSRQARMLADGDEEGFADLTRKLVAGRDEGRV